MLIVIGVVVVEWQKEIQLQQSMFAVCNTAKTLVVLACLLAVARGGGLALAHR